MINSILGYFNIITFEAANLKVAAFYLAFIFWY